MKYSEATFKRVIQLLAEGMTYYTDYNKDSLELIMHFKLNEFLDNNFKDSREEAKFALAILVKCGYISISGTAESSEYRLTESGIRFICKYLYNLDTSI